ncbi:glutamyl-tRNA reductase [Fluoribacter dumoffii]|uniref:Glutamyl-tRNA reductase n=1 Tax=Fluoribacter dumoffii TaxID=463 RepID=A0A377G828_9GAMM|nr:glutamyl-tRNA reductase [Fluoribacter dumoffii]KTC89389.1 glutamyl tRNA reductase [Fluoribacter dumoffii NY 23]MCW8386814.1 glutamyl-tRNA reductase [Fluoribacter dumoffii]MCW8417651.1 glutamyl-tRNA reductase [Fluoribacter dumoffii]MCW8454507.1 glutamyl-tRNA reductase [Fluoribacter dumoffii]MCW8461419.1 glutamyl-tRNA reductase [Fluoribacter dumoffii]
MVFVACGLNHKTAPINVREKVALSPATQDFVLESFLNLPEVSEAAILSTCNRTEIYCDIQDPQVILQWLAKEYQLSRDALSPYIYIHEDHQGIKHLLRVASGLDSMMIGEPQILGQMKQAYQHACSLGAIKTELRPIFEYVFSASKRIRTQSGIGTNPVSIAYAAAHSIGQFFTDYKSLKVFLIGSGETASLVAKYLRQQGVEHFMVASRTLENAEKLANTFNGQTVPITNIAEYLPKADVIVSATNCPIHFINKDLVEQALKQRNHTPMFFLDLSVPRDVEEHIKELEQVQLYNIDDLQSMIDKGMEERRHAALHAEQLVETELNKFIRKHRSLKAKQVICDYRSQMQDLAQKELQRALKKLSAGQCQQVVLNEFSERLVNKLTHNPTAGLRQIAKDGREELFTLAQYLFNTTTHQSSYEEIS